jgi:hypothetical protein
MERCCNNNSVQISAAMGSRFQAFAQFAKMEINHVGTKQWCYK